MVCRIAWILGNTQILASLDGLSIIYLCSVPPCSTSVILESYSLHSSQEPTTAHEPHLNKSRWLVSPHEEEAGRAAPAASELSSADSRLWALPLTRLPDTCCVGSTGLLELPFLNKTAALPKLPASPQQVWVCTELFFTSSSFDLTIHHWGRLLHASKRIITRHC